MYVMFGCLRIFVVAENKSNIHNGILKNVPDPMEDVSEEIEISHFELCLKFLYIQAPKSNNLLKKWFNWVKYSQDMNITKLQVPSFEPWHSQKGFVLKIFFNEFLLLS